MREAPVPVVTEPANILLDSADELLVLLARVGVIEAQERAPAGLFGNAEVETDRHDVADVQVAVGFGRKTGDDLGVLARRQVVVDDLADKVPRRGVAHELNVLG